MFTLVLFCSPCKGAFCETVCYQKGLLKRRIVQDVHSPEVLSLHTGNLFEDTFSVNSAGTVVFGGSIIGLEISAQYHGFMILKLEK